jgi:hypothetical protein
VANGKGQVSFVDAEEGILWRLDALGHPAAWASGLHAHALYGDAAGGLYGDDLVWTVGGGGGARVYGGWIRPDRG